MPTWAQAGFWGFVAGAALLIGAAVGYFIKVPQRLIPWPASWRRLH